MAMAHDPFGDGYDLAAEFAALADILQAADPLQFEHDPRWPRVLAYWERERQLPQLQAAYRLRHGAESVVSAAEAQLGQRLGGFVQSTPDRMRLHTREAFQLFTGRAPEPAGGRPPIVGARRLAAALRGLARLAEADNPYADWALLAAEQRLAQLTLQVDEAVAGWQAQLDALAQRGLQFAVLQAREPAALTLGFGSPYGYGVAQLVVAFDWAVRLCKTLVRKHQLADDDGRAALTRLRRPIRGLCEAVCRTELRLTQPALHGLTRADFLPSATADAQARLQAARAQLGTLPAAVLSGTVRPRHVHRPPPVPELQRQLAPLGRPADDPAGGLL